MKTQAANVKTTNGIAVLTTTGAPSNSALSRVLWFHADLVTQAWRMGLLRVVAVTLILSLAAYLSTH